MGDQKMSEASFSGIFSLKPAIPDKLGCLRPLKIFWKIKRFFSLVKKYLISPLIFFISKINQETLYNLTLLNFLLILKYPHEKISTRMTSLIGQDLSKHINARKQDRQTDHLHRIGWKNLLIYVMNYDSLALLKALERILQDNGLYLGSDSLLFRYQFLNSLCFALLCLPAFLFRNSLLRWLALSAIMR